LELRDAPPLSNVEYQLESGFVVEQTVRMLVAHALSLAAPRLTNAKGACGAYEAKGKEWCSHFECSMNSSSKRAPKTNEGPQSIKN
jgi:hypothetical protein